MYFSCLDDSLASLIAFHSSLVTIRSSTFVLFLNIMLIINITIIDIWTYFPSFTYLISPKHRVYPQIFLNQSCEVLNQLFVTTGDWDVSPLGLLSATHPWLLYLHITTVCTHCNGMFYYLEDSLKSNSMKKLKI